jgi:hypothetical protein
MHLARPLVGGAILFALLFTLTAVAACGSTAGARTASHASDASFAPVARVLRHPRCLNCHPSGDRPHVGDAARLHDMNVQRGLGGFGVPGMGCAACHRDRNQDAVHVPGAPNWHLAPRSMGWEGLDDHELAEAIKDRAKNGNRSLAELRSHLAEDPLVLWGWQPGVGREPVPVPHDVFVAAFDAWVAAGAPSPAPGTTTTFGDPR